MYKVLFSLLLIFAFCEAFAFNNSNIAVFAANPGEGSASASLEEKDGIPFVKTVFPKYENGKDHWPGLSTFAGDGYFDETDFGKYKYFYSLVYNPSDFPYVLIRVEDADGRVNNAQVPVAVHDYSLCCVETKQLTGIDLGRIKHIVIFLNEPSEDVEIWIGGLTLSDSIDDTALASASKTLLEKCDNLIKKLKTKKSEWCKTKLEDVIKFRDLLTGPASPEKENAVLTMQYVPEETEASIEYHEKKHSDNYSVFPVPSTLKLRNDQMPLLKKNASVRIDSAKGESESVSLLITANKKDIADVKLIAGPLRDRNGNYIYPEIHPLGYVYVKNPTPATGGFGIPGYYPDPILPNDAFSVEKGKNATCLYTVNVPRDAASGEYKGKITVQPEGERISEISVTLKVYDVTLLPQSYLKQIFVTRNTAANSKYYDLWTDEHFRAFTKLHMKYRLNCQQSNSEGILDFGKVYSADSKGRVTADWTAFDDAVRYWFSLGMTQFWGYFNGGAASVADIYDKDYLRSRLGLLAAHLKEMGWLDRFFLYFYDEPGPDAAERIIEVCDWVHREGAGLRIVHTYNHPDQEQFIGHADIIVSDIGYYDPETGKKARENKCEYWAYTCISNRIFGYPDNWKIDNYGVSHRALGWWLYKYRADGYLYWGTDFWSVDPWEFTETFPGGNGDGSLFYPSKDRSSLPYPSLRLDNYRDGVEDHDLLVMYEDRIGKDPLSALKKASSVVGKNNYSRDDELYKALHKELLEQLEKTEQKAKKKTRK